MNDHCPHVSEFSYRTECKRCRQQREARETRERDTQQRAWFERTGNCGACGQPGSWCQCTAPCGCAELHECGSGVGVDPAQVFADAPVSVDQGELFT